MMREILWIRPTVVDGVVRWPACEEREEPNKECLLAAKVDYRGKNLCKRHAASRALQELAKSPGGNPAYDDEDSSPSASAEPK